MIYTREKEYIYLTVEKEESVKEFLSSFCLSGKYLNNLSLNDKRVNMDTLLKKGDILKIKAYKEGIDYIPDQESIKVVYEDDWLLVVDKPKGIIIYPENKDGNGTLVNRIAKYYTDTRQNFPVRPVHRLDRDTDGLVLVAKSSFIQPKLDNMILNKEIERYYQCEVEGIIKNSGVIDKPIGRDRHDSHKMRVSKTGKEAKTIYKVLENKKDTTLVECLLKTGRTHQIRVHFSYIGHPVVNDPLYGKVKDDSGMELTAYKLVFIHPVTNKKTEIVKPV